MKVLAAMSGGVDSAVAAARAVDAGHEVVGVHLALSRMPGTLRTGSRGCCTVEDARDAHRAAGSLGIPFYVWDFSERFKEDIVDDFIAEYASGRTPNPCMRCNERIKFAALLDRALALGFDAVATGHYAEVRPGPSGEPELHRGADMAKDQSYVLGVLDARQLRHSYFPIGITSSKAEVRAEAAERGFTVADKPDSYDICFIPDGDTRSWLADKIPLRPGLIKDTEGTELGEHGGAQTFTIGQRKGLQIDQPAPGGRPRYVVDIDTSANTVTVGSREDLAVTRLRGIRTSWCGLPPEDIGADEGTGLDCEVQVRAHGESVPARAWLGSFSDVPGDGGVRAPGQRIEVRLAEPFSGVAPGQTMVLYAGTRVLGQATIDRAAREAAA